MLVALCLATSLVTIGCGDSGTGSDPDVDVVDRLNPAESSRIEATLTGYYGAPRNPVVLRECSEDEAERSGLRKLSCDLTRKFGPDLGCRISLTAERVKVRSSNCGTYPDDREWVSDCLERFDRSRCHGWKEQFMETCTAQNMRLKSNRSLLKSLRSVGLGKKIGTAAHPTMVSCSGVGGGLGAGAVRSPRNVDGLRQALGEI